MALYIFWDISSVAAALHLCVQKGIMVTNTNDNISKSLLEEIPEQYKGSHDFLDIISWNIRWFNDSDPKRVARMVEILGSINADVFIFQEVRNNSLDVVARRLQESGAGDYKVVYGATGGDQRMAIMYDFDWVKSKDDIQELFGKGAVRTKEGKDAFPRLPLWGYFYGKSVHPEKRGFDFQIAGVHFKSQAGSDAGSAQRQLAAEKLAAWLTHEADLLDSDAIVIGDWNAAPANIVWKAIHELEEKNQAQFSTVNDDTDFSHLHYRNRNEPGARLQAVFVSTAAAVKQPAPTDTVHWVMLEHLLDANPNEAAIKAYFRQIKNDHSDHMPLFARYYAADQP